ncbi:MAG: hypothetical protein JWL73_395 [Actinomycetia bacterium]|nr:hypothetical protein [Actinomycetes bacterium]
MAHAENDILIERSPDEVWAVTGDFGGLAAWMPGITRADVDGEGVRDVYMGDMLAAREKLVDRNEEQRALSYSIIGGAMPIESHVGTITVVAEGDGSKVTWAVDAEPAEVAEMLGGVYADALKTLKTHCEQ